MSEFQFDAALIDSKCNVVYTMRISLNLLPGDFGYAGRERFGSYSLLSSPTFFLRHAFAV